MVTLRWFFRLPWRRVVITIIVFLVIIFCVGVIAYGSASTSNDVALGLLAAISALLALGQWVFPFSPKQYEESQLPLACELVRGSFRMGDDAAANFPCIMLLIQETYATTIQYLIKSSSSEADKKQGILLLGESNAGKTRLALEALIEVSPG